MAPGPRERRPPTQDERFDCGSSEAVHRLGTEMRTLSHGWSTQLHPQLQYTLSKDPPPPPLPPPRLKAQCIFDRKAHIIPARPQLGISFYSTLFYVTLLYFSLIDFALLCFVLLALLYFTCLLLYLTASALTRQLGAKVKAMAKLKHN